MSCIPSHRHLVNIQNWLTCSSALRKHWRQRLLDSGPSKCNAPSFQEILIEWEDSPC